MSVFRKGDSVQGKVLQTVGKTITTQGVQTITNVADQQVGVGTDFQYTITPKGNNSKFLIKWRWFGESDFTENLVFNVLKDVIRVNSPSNANYAALSMATQTYPNAENVSTPEILTMETLDASGSVAGVPIVFSLIAGTGYTANITMWTNRCFSAIGGIVEQGVSEVIIMEIAA